MAGITEADISSNKLFVADLKLIATILHKNKKGNKRFDQIYYRTAGRTIERRNL